MLKKSMWRDAVDQTGIGKVLKTCFFFENRYMWNKPKQEINQKCFKNKQVVFDLGILNSVKLP